MVRVDTITFARRLRDSGVPADQAEAHAMAVHDYVQDFVTNDDLKTELDKLALRLTLRIGGVVGAMIALAVAYLELRLGA